MDFYEISEMNKKLNGSEDDSVVLALLSPMIAMIVGGLLACYF